MVFQSCIFKCILLVVLGNEINGDSADYSHEGTTATHSAIKFPRNQFKHIERQIYLKPNEVLVGDAIHELVGKNAEFTRQVTKFENSYRSYLRMEGVKYNFKRDGFWKTWRPVRFPDDKDRAVYYKCMANKDENDADCQKNGQWEIEEKQQDCPFEIFAMNNKKYLCGSTFQNVKSTQHCPNEISLEEIHAKCPNLVITRMRFSKHHDTKHLKASPRLICGGKDSCDVTTLYQINSTQILFQIINSNDDIVFSKLMKPNKHNYVCMKSCGNTLGRHLQKDDKKVNSKSKPEVKKATKVKVKTNLVSKPKIMTKTIKLSKKTGKPLIRSKRSARKNKVIKEKNKILIKNKKHSITKKPKPHVTKSLPSTKKRPPTTKKSLPSTKKSPPTTKKSLLLTIKSLPSTEKSTKKESFAKPKANSTKHSIIKSSKKNLKTKRETKVKTKKHAKNLKKKPKKSKLNAGKSNKKNAKEQGRPKRKTSFEEDKEKYRKKHKKATEYQKEQQLKSYHKNRNMMSPELKKYLDDLDVKKQNNNEGVKTKSWNNYLKRYISVHPFFNS